MEIVTPEQLMGIKPKPITFHHGTCDLCHARNVMVVHFGYDTQPVRDYRLCAVCLSKYLGKLVGFVKTFKEDTIIWKERQYMVPVEELEEFLIADFGQKDWSPEFLKTHFEICKQRIKGNFWATHKQEKERSKEDN